MPRRLPRASQPGRPADDTTSAQSTSFQDVALAVALLLSLIAAYWPSLHGTLVWDDAAHVTRSDLRSFGGLWRIWFDVGATQQYYPLLHSAFWIEHRLWGDHVLGYHLVNVLWHFASALCIVGISRQLNIRGGWLAAWIFALHPVQVESVAWITEQKNTLSLAFTLGAALAYLRFDASRRTWTYAAATLLFGCALLSKTTAATLPAALLVVVWWKRGRVDAFSVRFLVPWLVIGIVAGSFTAWVEHRYIGAAGSEFTLTAVQHVLLAGRIVCFYAATLAWPAHLTFNYPRWDVDPAVWWQYLFPLAVAGVMCAAWFVRRKTRAPLATALLFVGILVPTLGFVNVYPFVYSYVADHFQYQASVALIVSCAAWLTSVFMPLARPAPIVASALVVALGTMTFRESASYANVETLYRETIARNPASWMAYENLGVLLVQIPGRLSEGVEALRAAARLAPSRAGTHRNLAIALSQTHDWRGAVEHYQRAIAIDSDEPIDHVNMARALIATDEKARAMTHVRRALQLAPDLADAHTVMGRLLEVTDPPAAIAELRRAIQLEPTSAEAHLALATIFARRPDWIGGAIAEYREALVLRPDSFEAAYNLGTLLLDRPGAAADAVTALAQAVSLRPDDPRARTNLGIALQDAGETREAIAQWEAAVRLAPDLDVPRRLLAQLARPK